MTKTKSNFPKKLLNKIIKQCGRPEEYVFDYINGASDASDIRRMKDYVACVRKVEREFKKIIKPI